MTRRVEHLAAGEDELDRPSDMACRERRQCHVWPGPQSGAECPADERADHVHVVGRHAEHGSDLGRLVDHNWFLLRVSAVAVPRAMVACGSIGLWFSRAIL